MLLSCEETKKKRPTQQSILFTPRQVILSNPIMKQQQQLTSDQRVLLYHSISHFLDLNGFLKSLNKFRKETHLEKDSWKSSSLNLEEIFQEYLQKRGNDKANVPNVKQKDGSNHDISAEIVKGAKENEADDGKKSNTKLENNAVSGDDAKSKKKKKKETKDIDSSKHLNGEANLKENEHPVEDAKKSKDKRKKKHMVESEPLEKELLEKKAEDAAGQPSEKENDVPQKPKSKSKKIKEETLVEKDEFEKEKKSSKKRKKSSSDDNDTEHAEETQIDDSKRRKIDNSVQSNGAEQAPKTPKGSANGVLDNGSVKKSENLNKTNERDDSTQPRSANAFRRVKADEVEFADERLQDNSYWAKNGADSGYGAKAQEVLGQVRGRDFRHEKTKKKRGSYRGGQIDLQSHSIKFNYDEEDE